MTGDGDERAYGGHRCGRAVHGVREQDLSVAQKVCRPAGRRHDMSGSGQALESVTMQCPTGVGKDKA